MYAGNIGFLYLRSVIVLFAYSQRGSYYNLAVGSVLGHISIFMAVYGQPKRLSLGNGKLYTRLISLRFSVVYAFHTRMKVLKTAFRETSEKRNSADYSAYCHSPGGRIYHRVRLLDPESVMTTYFGQLYVWELLLSDFIIGKKNAVTCYRKTDYI